jgi:hypothetical protein
LDGTFVGLDERGVVVGLVDPSFTTVGSLLDVALGELVGTFVGWDKRGVVVGLGDPSSSSNGVDVG